MSARSPSASSEGLSVATMTAWSGMVLELAMRSRSEASTSNTAGDGEAAPAE